MACDTRPRRRDQTLSERKAEVKKVVETVSEKLAAGRVKMVVGANGAVAFTGITEEERGGVTDACVYRLIMATGSALARAAIARAEQLSGRSVNRQVVASGAHSHDGGKSWHHH